jgi:glycosyltransferase involved in cell wall biosynthesis
MPGPLPAREIAELMRRTRVVVVPSVTAASGDTEGLPMAAVEALASGTPVVGTRHSGIPEAVVEGKSGLLVPERDVDALADRLTCIMGDDGLWSRLAAGARSHAEAEFDLRTQSARLEEIYIDAVASSP